MTHQHDKKKHERPEVIMSDEQSGAKKTTPDQPVEQQESGPDRAQETAETSQEARLEAKQESAATEIAAAEIPTIEEVEKLKKELEESRSQTSEYLDGWQRARAEFANYKKRMDRDQSQIQQMVAGNLIKRYLEIIDDLDRALKNRPKGEEGAAWAAGIELVYRKFMAILESEGVKVMQVEGQTFDPNLHEAISQTEVPGYDSGQIVEEIHKGYMIGERVLRPALVRVAK